MKFSEIKESANEYADGRTFPAAKYERWIKRVRESTAMDAVTRGFDGLYFLYKEATVKGGTVANEPKYAMPSDFIVDLQIFLDKTYVPKVAPGVMDITQTRGSSGTVKWFRNRGVYFELIPAPDTADKEILLLYNGMPDTISQSDQEDFFMKHFPDLHIFGMAEMACRSIGLGRAAAECKNDYMNERKKLWSHNTMHHVRNARLRFQNWDEYKAKREVVFPQFQES